MQRRVGQHDADVRIARRDAFDQSRAGAPREQDGRLGRQQSPLFCFFQAAARAYGVQAREHHREGLGVAALAPSELCHGAGIRRVDQQLEPAQAAQREDPAARDQPRGLTKSVLAARRLVAEQRELWAAARAGDGLGVEAAVERIGVFAGAVGAERKALHRGAHAVVRQALYDRVARAAAGAVGERIAVAPFARPGNLRKALGARGQIGGQRGVHLAATAALPDLEAGLGPFLDDPPLDGVDAPRRRQVLFQRGDEGRKRRVGPLYLDAHAVAAVLDPAGKAARRGGSIGEGPEADALHHALYRQREAGHARTAERAPPSGGARTSSSTTSRARQTAACTGADSSPA